MCSKMVKVWRRKEVKIVWSKRHEDGTIDLQDAHRGPIVPTLSKWNANGDRLPCEPGYVKEERVLLHIKKKARASRGFKERGKNRTNSFCRSNIIGWGYAKGRLCQFDIYKHGVEVSCSPLLIFNVPWCNGIFSMRLSWKDSLLFLCMLVVLILTL